MRTFPKNANIPIVTENISNVSLVEELKGKNTDFATRKSCLVGIRRQVLCGETTRGIHAFQFEHLPATWNPQNLWRNEFNTMKTARALRIWISSYNHSQKKFLKNRNGIAEVWKGYLLLNDQCFMYRRHT